MTGTSIREQLVESCREAVRSIAPDIEIDVASTIQSSKRPELGDYQCNVALRLAKPLGRSPRAIAEELTAAVAPTGLWHAPEVSDPGFVNFRIQERWLGNLLLQRTESGRVALPAPVKRRNVLIDFSSPNVAKEMHVGHLRSTIIGDVLARVFKAAGHEVERVSHVGDWGTQFGMLITYLREEVDTAAEPDEISIGDLDAFYKAAKRRFDADPTFADRSRQAVVALQSGEPAATESWQLLCELSRREFQEIYDRLHIDVVEQGESFYQPFLAGVVEELTEKGLVEISDGAKCVFLPGFKNQDGDPLPLMIQKGDGGFNYATTDLAALKYRIDKGADTILYVIDHGQSLHMSMVFETARRAGWLTDAVEAVHVPFGLVLGSDHKRFRTRDGGTVRLRDLIDEAVKRAREVTAERLAETSDVERANADVERVGEIVGVGAVKYAELSHGRMTNYVFSFDKMISLQGNTAPYMLYVYARIRGIVDEAASRLAGEPPSDAIAMETSDERALAVTLSRFTEIVEDVMVDYAPNTLCDYLFRLSQDFNRVYENSRVIAMDGTVDRSRLNLCMAAATTLKTGLDLLGIETMDRV